MVLSMSDTWVGLLKAVNVGGRNRVKMAELVALTEGLGFEDVSTYVQSGNLIFDGGGRDPESIRSDVEGALAEQCDIGTILILRRPGELASTLDRHPFRDDVDDSVRPTALHVAFCLDRPTGGLDGADADRVAPDRAVVDGREVFLAYPSGTARSKLTGALLERRLGVEVTARNWRTVSELVARSA